MRKHYVDILRIMCIALLFPYHTCRIYTTKEFYIHQDVVGWCDIFVKVVSPWFMPLMFLLAGISAYYSLAKRSNGTFIKERFTKLFIPCIIGIVFFAPLHTYLAVKTHLDSQVTYIENLKDFFTNPGDLTGYTGGFTPSHFWFLLSLFVLSIVALPFIKLIRRMNEHTFLANPALLMLLFIPLMLSSYVGTAGDKYNGMFLLLLIIGALLCSNEKSFEAIEKWRYAYLAIAVLCYIYSFITDSGMLCMTPSTAAISLAGNLVYFAGAWSVMLCALGFGKRFLNFSNGLTKQLSAMTFPIYLIHQTVLVILAYFTVSIVSVMALQYIIIIVITLVLSVLIYEISRRFALTRLIFGIK